MLTTKTISKYELHLYFDYNPETGKLYWKKRPFKSRIKVGDEAGSLRPDGYYQVMLKGEVYYLHRVIWAWVHGEWPPTVDHWDENNGNNKLVNLRGTTYSGNNRNVTRFADRNKTGFVGVRQESSGRFVATKYGKYLGVFSSKEQAAKAYKAYDDFAL